MRSLIEVSDLHKSYGKTQVLKGINLGFERSKITVILGPNGSGKTTLMKSILGMVIPNNGTIRVLDQEIKREWSYRNHISYLPQVASFPGNLSVKDLFDMMNDLRGLSGIRDDLIEDFGLAQFLNIRLSNLSGGTKQKVNVVMAFAYDSPIIILDEPTTGLDPVALLTLKDIISKKREEGKVLLISTHIMGLVEELADEIVFLLEGNVYFKGTPESLKEMVNESNIERAIAKILVEHE